MVPPAECAHCPCIVSPGRPSGASKGIEQPFQISIEDSVFYAPIAQHSGEPRDACRRFSRLCNRRVYKKYQDKAFSKYLSNNCKNIIDKAQEGAMKTACLRYLIALKRGQPAIFQRYSTSSPASICLQIKSRRHSRIFQRSCPPSGLLQKRTTVIAQGFDFQSEFGVCRDFEGLSSFYLLPGGLTCNLHFQLS